MLIHGVGDTPDEATRDHEKNLTSLLKHCKEKSMRLNKEKVRESATTELNGTSTDYARFEVKAILKLETAKTKEVINRLNGTLNYLSKFLPKLSRVLEPLRRLTQKGVEFC